MVRKTKKDVDPEVGPAAEQPEPHCTVGEALEGVEADTRVVQWTDPRGRRFFLAYDGSAQPDQVADALTLINEEYEVEAHHFVLSGNKVGGL